MYHKFHFCNSMSLFALGAIKAVNLRLFSLHNFQNDVHVCALHWWWCDAAEP